MKLNGNNLRGVFDVKRKKQYNQSIKGKIIYHEQVRII